MDSQAFALHVDEDSDCPVVEIAGDFDVATAPTVSSRLLALGDQSIVLDLTEVSFLDSSAIGVLLAALKRATNAGNTVTLRGVQPAQLRVLRIAGVADALGLHGEDGSH